LQNRRNKTSSKEIDTGDTEMIHAYSSVKSSDSMYDCQTFLSWSVLSLDLSSHITLELNYLTLFIVFRPEKKRKKFGSPPEENGSQEQRKTKREKKNNARSSISTECHSPNASGGALRWRVGQKEEEIRARRITTQVWKVVKRENQWSRQTWARKMK